MIRFSQFQLNGRIRMRAMAHAELTIFNELTQELNKQ